MVVQAVLVAKGLEQNIRNGFCEFKKQNNISRCERNRLSEWTIDRSDPYYPLFVFLYSQEMSRVPLTQELQHLCWFTRSGSIQ